MSCCTSDLPIEYRPIFYERSSATAGDALAPATHNCLTQCVQGTERSLACPEVCGGGHISGDHDPDDVPVAVGRIDSLVGCERHGGYSNIIYLLCERVDIAIWFVECGDLSADGACGQWHERVFGFNDEND